MVSICCGGCFQVMGEAAHDNAVEKFPAYAQTKAAWGEIPAGHGRVVLFIEKSGVNPFMLAGSGFDSFAFEIDSSKKVDVVDQVFVFIDLPAGKHTVNSFYGGYPHQKKPEQFEVLPGETKYIGGDLKSVASEEAERKLDSIYHNFEKALPFDKQEASAPSAYSEMMK